MSTAPAEEALEEFSGVDHLSAVANAGICAIIGIVACFIVPRAILPYVVAVAVVAVPVAAATRYRLRISTAGIEWSVLLAWALPVQRQRYLLDAEVDLYESLEATKPEGVCIHPVRFDGDEKESPCFGPSFNQAAIASLHQRANEAIQRARKLLPATPLDLRCPPLEKGATKLDVRGAKRNGQNRLREVEVFHDLTVGGLSLPPGTVLELNGEDYLDPRRQDRLIAAVVKTQLRLPIGIDAPPGTRILVTSSGEISGLRGPLGLIHLDGFPIDGNAHIGVDEDGRASFFTLGAEMELGGWALSAGTTFSTWPKMFDQGPAWYCTLAGVLRLPELELGAGDSAVFDKASKTLVQVHTRGERVGGAERFSGSPIPVHPDGRIDWKRAR
ncbi:MAG TPA: hypothetical protein VND93_32630, partial [Myxococcales bacterium]|nr:hypothetical protein [Myxococcales bacterium]